MNRILYRLYKRVLSPMLHAGLGLGGACRFQPTCSEYASLALSEHGFLRGTGLAVWRLLRCQPFSRGGFDPVPERRGATPVTIEPVDRPTRSQAAGPFLR